MRPDQPGGHSVGRSAANVDSRGDRPALSRDEGYALLANRRRRYVIDDLHDRDEPVGLGLLAERVAAWEHDVPLAAVDSGQRKSVYTSLLQTHLPKLEAAGIVTYDADRKVVALAPSADALERYAASRSNDAWYRYYFVGSVLGGLLLVTTWLGAIPLGRVGGLVNESLIVALFALVTLGYLLRGGGWEPGALGRR